MNPLAAEIRRRLGPAPDLAECPPVSIIVLNRDGVGHLRRLLEGLVERTDYPDFELIVVDNGSRDESVDFLRSVEAPFPISILANPHNESFSDANNQGAELASGELLLFLNNDIEPFEPGWLRELVACLQASGAGAVSSTLLCPEGDGGSASDYRVQTRQVRLQGSGDEVSSDRDGSRRGLFDAGFGEDAESAFGIGACLLIDGRLFRHLGGFTHGYFYGGEDVDLVLKLRTEGRSFVYSGRSILIHHAGSTRGTLNDKGNGFAETGNGRLLWERWGPRVWREYELDRLAGGGLWAVPGQETPRDAPSREEVLALGFCLKGDELADGKAGPMEELRAELARRGHRCLVLHGDSVDDRRALGYDVVVHVRGSARYVPNRFQLNVLWIVSHLDTATGTECRRYDLAVTDVAKLVTRLRRDSGPTPVIALDGGHAAQSLVDAALARAGEIALPMRVDPS